MSAEPGGGTNAALAGAGILMVLCCVVAPAVIGAVAGSAVGGWLGIVCAVVVAGLVGFAVHRRERGRGGC